MMTQILEHNKGNPECSGATQLAISQAWPRIRTRGYREQIQPAVKAGPHDYKSNALTTRTPCLLF